MSISLLIVICIACFIFSTVLTSVIRKYAVNQSLYDYPNDRSSHIIPTPTGGGLSISFSFIIGTFLLGIWGKVSIDIIIALGGGGLLVAIIGWIDDHRDIPATLRIIAYFIAAIWALFWLDGFKTITIGLYQSEFKYIGSLLAVLGIVWLTNLYNFMDGADGVAGIQTITTAFLSGMLFWISNQQGIATICFILMAASAGFLVWNWPPAKIFMGDVGSCLIGFSFGILILIGEKTESVPILIWIILLAVFICDATLTLIKRVIMGERWYNAHRSHSYQRFVQSGASHAQLALLLLFINIVLLWPIAFVAFKQDYLSVYMTLLAVIIVTAAWIIIQLRYYYLKKHLGVSCENNKES